MGSSVSSSFYEILSIMAGTRDTAGVDAEDLESAMKGRLDGLPESNPYTFSRVPAYIREKNKKLYEPMVIAIGPYHHHRENLQAMQKHKWWYVRDLLSRFTTGASLGDCIRKMRALEEAARRCYSESIAFESDEFVEMMLLDACFIIEFFLKSYGRDETLRHMGWGLQFIPMDLHLFENQIPFFIIKELFQLVVGNAERRTPSLIDLIWSVEKKISILKMHSSTLSTPATIHHLLHLYHFWFVPVVERAMGERSEGIPNWVVPCAAELSEVGVDFRKKKQPRHMLDITFRNGVMEIPCIVIQDFSKPLFINLVAFEQFMCDSQMTNMTSFSRLMDSLINSEKDVAILQSCDVIKNLLGSEEDVALFFNQLCEYANMIGRDHCFAEMVRQVNCYHDSKLHRYRARLVHDYFSSPCATLSLVAALILLSLTFLQTIIAFYSYFHP